MRSVARDWQRDWQRWTSTERVVASLFAAALLYAVLAGFLLNVNLI